MEVLALYAMIFGVIWMFPVGFAYMFGGPDSAGKVLAMPFRFIGRMLGRILGGVGRGIMGVLQNIWSSLLGIPGQIHGYFYRRWPKTTALFYISLMALAWLAYEGRLPQIP